MPRVAVIITSYNQEAYLREAIDSVLEQTRRPDEIIVADDHSTKDNSIQMIEQYAARYPGLVRPLFQKQNLGIPQNRNSALEMVTSGYVAILDGDDRFLPTYIERQLTELSANPDAGCSYSNRFSIDARGERIEIRDRRPMPSGDILFQVACGRPGILRSMLGRYDLIKTAGLLDERFPLHDGYILSLRLARMTKFVYVAEPLMEKREHVGGVSKALSSRQWLQYFQDVFAEVTRVTDDLQQWQKRRIKKVWSRKILNPRVLAEVEAGRKSSALWMVARAFARDPGNSRNLRQLIRNVLERELA